MSLCRRHKYQFISFFYDVYYRAENVSLDGEIKTTLLLCCKVNKKMFHSILFCSLISKGMQDKRIQLQLLQLDTYFGSSKSTSR